MGHARALFTSFRRKATSGIPSRSGRLKRAERRKRQLQLESLEGRRLLAATLAVTSGNWNEASTWSNGVPTASTRAIIGQGKTVTLAHANQVAQEVVVHGQLVAEEGAVGSPNKTLTADWIHVNSGGVFQIGTETNRYDNHDFVLTLTGTNPNADFTVETAMGTMQIEDNDGFLMTAMGGSLQFFGDEKLSFTKLATTEWKNSTSIRVENVIERNFDGTTSAASDGSLVGSQAWEVGDQIVIASSSNNYAHQDVRTITGVNVQGSETVLALNAPTSHRHYGNVEYYKNGDLSIDLRAEVALLNRSIIVQGTQDTDSNFGNRARYGTTSGRNLGIGGHAMFMPNSGPINIDSVQFDKMGQTGKLGRYPVHWHLGADRTGDSLRNSSVTNSNNRGVTVHGTQGLLIEGNVLHDIHGHGFFMEDAAEFDNQFLYNIALGIHKVGGANRNDPFIVPGITRGSNGQVNGEAPRNGLGEGSHDTGQQVFERFLSSAAYWITNPDNVWIGNISAGSEGTGFWFILPDRVIGLSRDTGLYNGMDPGETNLGTFDNNTSHSSPVGLTFDRGSDIRGGGSVGYTPTTRATFNNFTGYKHNGTAVYHRGNNVTFDGSSFADVKSGSFNTFSQEERNILFVGHSQGNSDASALVGGYKLYDGPGRIIGAHFAGFTANNAHTFLNTGGAHKHAMPRAEGITFEADGTANNVSVYFQDASGFTNDTPANAAGRPDAISGIVLDVDGSLTGHVGGGAGHVLTPRVDFYRDSTDLAPAGWNAYVSDDRFGYLQLNTISGSGNFPYFRVENGDGHRLVVNRRNITRQRLYTKLNAGDYTFTFTEPVPSAGFTVRMDVMRGQQPGDYSVYRFQDVGADYKPTSGSEQATLQALRDSTSNAYFRDAGGDLWMKVFESGATIQIRPTNDPPTSLEIDQLTLIDADSDEDIFALTNGMVVNLTALPTTNLNVRATTNNQAGSVGFVLTGPSPHTQTESIDPYSLFGDANGDFDSENLAVGQYTLTATPYSGAGLSGTAGTAMTVNFEVIQPNQLPFIQQTVSGGTLIRAEEFDLGGPHVAYHDTTPGNQNTGSGAGETFRPGEDVDLIANSIFVNRTVDGEWLEYTRDVIPGIYDIDINAWSNNSTAKAVRLLIADNPFSSSFTELGSVEIPDTDNVRLDFTIPDVDLTAWGGDDRVFRVEFFSAPQDIVVAPVNAELLGESHPYVLEYGSRGSHWYDGSGLLDLTTVETGDPVPAVWPEHYSGSNSGRVSRIRSAPEFNTLTFALGGTFDVNGMVLWNSTEQAGNGTLQTDRGFENTRLSYSTDGGNTFTGNDLLTWTELTDYAVVNQASNPTDAFPPEVRMLPNTVEDVTHVRMIVDNFSVGGADNIVMASELRFIAEGQVGNVGENLNLSFNTIEFSNELDFGDAPASYSTLVTDGGARHLMEGPQLGPNRDAESDGAASPAADGDGSDDDGVMFSAITAGDSVAGLNILLENIPLENEPAAKVDAWIDFDRDGVWSEDEKILDDRLVDQPMQTLSFDLPAGLTAGDTFARVRLSSVGGLQPTGFAADGEVEDYLINVGSVAPEVEDVVINDGSANRSKVTSVTVHFDSEVDHNALQTAFTVTNVTTSTDVGTVNVSATDSGGKTTAVLTFDGASTLSPLNAGLGNTLVDGNYRLDIFASQVVLASNSSAAMTSDHSFGGQTSEQLNNDDFFRWYGDDNGDGFTDFTDFASGFLPAFGNASNYNEALDANGDGFVDFTDFANGFLPKFGTSRP